MKPNLPINPRSPVYDWRLYDAYLDGELAETAMTEGVIPVAHRLYYHPDLDGFNEIESDALTSHEKMIAKIISKCDELPSLSAFNMNFERRDDSIDIKYDTDYRTIGNDRYATPEKLEEFNFLFNRAIKSNWQN